MLAKRHRLSRSDFDTLLKKGSRVNTEHFTLLYIPALTMKCGVVVSKKVGRQAVLRNKLRRRIFSILGAHQHILPNAHLAVFTKKSLSQLPFNGLERELADVLKCIVVKK